ncbi:Mitochondrial inner membrane protease subunit 1 [Psilocybe cubensis]|uniref:Peptidase S26 domain-containing protein n=2 Tax=Psilocybe cubensis TaxID=181762 RepID=A0A8H7YA75_PSICU|nr:Mitochondrial inner membrane protease subunit 1 [Psilocybe cubensis]KAH9486749.1 Mitochondrial inner membrane protease subunit 1 [Psilocybe cubensis]
MRYSKRAAVGSFKVFNFLFAVHIFMTYVGRFSFMAGPSMLPTFAVEGEIVIEDFITYRLFPDKMKRGDLLIVRSPIEPTKVICKRLIGLPGDIVCVDPSGVVYPSTEHVVVPKGHVWISGDNALASRDSRMYGPVPIGLVKGRVFARVWPLNSFKVFTNQISYIE